MAVADGGGKREEKGTWEDQKDEINCLAYQESRANNRR